MDGGLIRPPQVCRDEARGYVENYGDGRGLLVLISPTGCFKDRLMGVMRAGAEVVLKERLCGRSRLSYGVRRKLETHRAAPQWEE